MRFSPAQLQDMTAERDDAYARRLSDFLRRKYPDFAAQYDAFTFDTGVRDGIREGRRWDVRSSDGMVAAATLCLLSSSELFDEPKVQAFLRAEDGYGSIDRKMIQLVDRVWQTLDAEGMP